MTSEEIIDEIRAALEALTRARQENRERFQAAVGISSRKKLNIDWDNPDGITATRPQGTCLGARWQKDNIRFMNAKEFFGERAAKAIAEWLEWKVDEDVLNGISLHGILEDKTARSSVG